MSVGERNEEPIQHTGNLQSLLKEFDIKPPYGSLIIDGQMLPEDLLQVFFDFLRSIIERDT